MNVFVLCTGRCGSTTFIKACGHITNYSSGHESKRGLFGDSRFAYPPNHIEADNRLSWFLGRMDKYYGPDAVYVHLKRDVNQTAASFVKRYESGIMDAYKRGIIMKLPADVDPMAVALDYCETVDSNIAMFLKDKPKKMEFLLGRAKQDFPRFCGMVGADVNMANALAEFDCSYNASVT